MTSRGARSRTLAARSGGTLGRPGARGSLGFTSRSGCAGPLEACSRCGPAGLTAGKGEEACGRCGRGRRAVMGSGGGARGAAWDVCAYGDALYKNDHGAERLR